jgi:hypothetical protein
MLGMNTDICMNTDTYIIAVKRQHRGSEPTDWKEQIAHTSGVKVLSAKGPRLQVRASDEAISRILPDYDDVFHVEKQIIHRPQSSLSA